MARHWILVPGIGVRIPEGQPTFLIIERPSIVVLGHIFCSSIVVVKLYQVVIPLPELLDPVDTRIPRQSQ